LRIGGLVGWNISGYRETLRKRFLGLPRRSVMAAVERKVEFAEKNRQSRIFLPEAAPKTAAFLGVLMWPHCSRWRWF
jgi:hypothetical protein